MAKLGLLVSEGRPLQEMADEDEKQQPLVVSRARARAEFMDLPTELHIMISKLLIYPDALSLKHSSNYLYNLVDTGVSVKVEWLILRHNLHLKGPDDKKCDLRSDLQFCRGSIPMLIQHYRNHIECEAHPGIGCMIYNTKECFHRRKLVERVCQWSHGDALRLIIAILALSMSWLLPLEGFGVDRRVQMSVREWMVPFSATCMAILLADAVQSARLRYRQRRALLQL
ncbi:hypothetical protein CFIMG_002511RA [Ceratocystis fimbriata CBS 114723]|uniref:F-box domain-containing protein n=1 Tax=Ceratocystis fimbriata CBS 114723 TaxID=1035309 RepID=A0A2C5WKF0_9PEZI|nr:hypothetical protein CFIMG_002511RA [Ceratocystis fimbriata CBS 114723]